MIALELWLLDLGAVSAAPERLAGVGGLLKPGGSYFSVRRRHANFRGCPKPWPTKQPPHDSTEH